MPANNYLEELMKIAEDMNDEPMNPDAQVAANPDEVAQTQSVSDEELAAAQAAMSAQADIQPSEADVIAAMEADIAGGQTGMTPEEEAIVEQAIAEEAAAAQGAPSAEEQLPPEPGVELPPEEEEIISAMEEEQVANEVIDALHEKVASELISLATISKVVECSRGGEYISEELQKQANDILEEMVQDADSFDATMERVAGEMFAVEENVQQLFSRSGLHMVFEQLAMLDSEGLDKQADEDPGAIARLRDFATDAISSAKQKVVEAANSATHLKQISAELAQAAEAIKEPTDLVGRYGDQLENHMSADDIAQFRVDRARVADLTRQQNMGRGVIGAGAGIAAAGAAYGGKKLYDHMHQEEKIAGVLPALSAGGTLNVGSKNENTGGIQKMSKELVNDFLKIAGAAGLVSITADEQVDMEIRKEASDAFNEIATMGRQDMDQELVKVAQRIYTEDQLHEIVAGYHTENLFDKVAFFVDAVDAPIGEVLEKVANADGVSAVKNIGPGLKDSATNILNTIKESKEATEAGGREYVGEMGGKQGSGPGKAGGALNGTGALSGYNALKNPQKYDIEQTASQLEDAVMLKQAAIDSYRRADEFIKAYSQVR